MALPTLDLTPESTAEAPSTRPSLDALLSPPLIPAGSESKGVESDQDDDFDELPLEESDDKDARFSMVPLQTPSSATSPTTQPLPDSPAVEDVPTDSSADRRPSSLSSLTPQKSPPPSTRVSLTNDNATTSSQLLETGPHDSSASATTPTLPFLFARLDLQKEILESNPKAQRASIDGHDRLRNGFQKLQEEKEGKIVEPHDESQIDWEFWGAVMADYEHVARTESQRLATAIERGIPAALRGMVWQLMSASKDVELEQAYSTLLKESSSHEKAIMRDLGRTFPTHAFFQDGKGIGQENLFNVLKAYALYDPEVGYCQGLAFIVAILLLNMPDEEAFCVLVRLMFEYRLRSFFVPEMPGLQLRLYQFDRLVEELLPVLHLHFLRQGVKSSMYCSQWFLTMFSYRFPLPIVYRIFDALFATGIEAIFGFSIALLQINEEKILSLKFDQILDFLKNTLFDAYLEAKTPVADADSQGDATYEADRFVQDALRVKITPFMLDNFAGEWEDILRQKNAHAEELLAVQNEMEGLRAMNRNLSAQLKTLEHSLAQMNEDHVDIVKQLVMAKVEREDLENELIKYKLLYAEQMQANDDASSSHRASSGPFTPSPAPTAPPSRLSSWSSLALRK